MTKFNSFCFLQVLKKLTPSAEDRESLEQAEGVFQPLKAELERLCSSTLPKRKQGYVYILFHLLTFMFKKILLYK